MEIEISDEYNSCKILRIKTYPHLRKFIKSFYRTKSEDLVRVDRNSSLGMTMFEVLRNPRKVNSKEQSRFTDEISFLLNQHLSKLSITNKFVLRFNTQMDVLFKEHCVQWIMAQVENGMSASEAIRSFQKKYHINESDYSFENIYRNWTRWKNDEYYRLKNISV